MRKFTKSLVSLLLAFVLTLGFIPFQNTIKAQDETKKQTIEEKKANNEPLLFGYYRVWHDRKNGKSDEGRGKTGDPKGIQNMGELPKGLDVAFLFVDWIDNDLGYRKNPFWNELPNYIEKLHSKGTKVVRTIDISLITNEAKVPEDEYNKKLQSKRKFENNKEGYQQLAKLIFDEYVVRDNLDGLDIDMEHQTLPTDKLKMAIGVINELSNLLKEQNKLFIFDTDKRGNTKIFQETADKYDYVLYQSYRQENLDEVFDTFKSKIPATKFVPGFSFYEEGDRNKWFNLSSGNYRDWNRDTNAKLEDTFAYRSAMWQPRNKEDGTKGGLFAFAVERSGVKDGEDQIKPADYSVLEKIDNYLHQSHKERLGESVKNLEEKVELQDSNIIENKNLIPFARWSSGDPINKINDGIVNYENEKGNRWTDWKPSEQLKENWVGFVFGSSVDVREAEVSEVNIDFYNDHGVYLPKEYKVQYFTGKLNEKNLPEKYGFAENSVLDNNENWTNVDVKEYPKAKSFGTTVLKFKPVKTKAIRILMQADQKSLGLTELKVKGELTDKAPIKRDLSDEELKAEINNLDKLGDNAKDFIGKIGSQTNNSLLEAAKSANEYMKELENLPLPKKPVFSELKAPLYGGWFRTWHDQNSDPLEDRPNYFGDIPREVDLAFVFHAWTKPYSEFWKKLALEYVPEMNARGQRVIRTIGIKNIYSDIKDENGKSFPNTVDGNKSKAKYIVDTMIDRYGLDGIDIDIEYHDGDYYIGKEKQGIEIMKEISRLLKEQGKIFMIDTNMSGSEEILKGIYDDSDYVLLQAYGNYSDNLLNSRWQGFKPYIKPEKFILGFSFYEERGNQWGDISDKVEGSAAERYAKWQPENGKNGKKAGIIGYAIDRDGMAVGDDSIKTTTYSHSKQLKRIMEFADVEDEIAEINKLTLLTSQEKDMYERWLKDGLNSKEALLPSDIVKSAKEAQSKKEDAVKRDLIDSHDAEEEKIKSDEENAEKKLIEAAKKTEAERKEKEEKEKGQQPGQPQEPGKKDPQPSNPTQPQVTKKAPKVEEGKDAVYLKKSGKTLRFKSDAPLNLLQKVLVDKKELTDKDYSKTSGSTIVELTNKYLESLSLGKHTLSLVFGGNNEYNAKTLEIAFMVADGGSGSIIVPETESDDMPNISDQESSKKPETEDPKQPETEAETQSEPETQLETNEETKSTQNIKLVEKDKDTKNPETSDAGIMSYVAMTAVSLAGAFAIRRKNK